jgi:hypothetical protein
MNVSNIYRKLKQILSDSNTALINKGYNAIDTLSNIPDIIENMGEINRLPYFLNKNAVAIFEDDLYGNESIYEGSFKNWNNLISVTIPDNVRYI